MCYTCRIPDMDDNTVFHIVCKHFRVDQKSPDGNVFETPSAALTTAPLDNAEDRASTVDIASNVVRGEVMPEEIADLRAQGIEVDNEDPARENVVEPPPIDATRQVGEWITPIICARKADSKIKKQQKTWFHWIIRCLAYDMVASSTVYILM